LPTPGRDGVGDLEPRRQSERRLDAAGRKHACGSVGPGVLRTDPGTPRWPGTAQPVTETHRPVRVAGEDVRALTRSRARLRLRRRAAQVVDPAPLDSVDQDPDRLRQ